MAKPIIGFICDDVKTGSEFYKKFEALMALIWPDETQRPIVYAEFGLPNRSQPEVVDLDSCDYVFNIKAPSLENDSHVPSLDHDAHQLMHYLRGSIHLDAQQARDFHNVFLQISKYNMPKDPQLNPNKKINVIAGMGPIAGANFISSLASELDSVGIAKKSTLQIYSNPQLPGKHFPFTAGSIWQAMLHAIDYLLRFRKFVNNTEGVLVAPCNTFHTNIPFLKVITKIQEKILHIVKQVEIRMFEAPKCTTVAIMGTERTVKKDLYESTFDGSGKVIFSLKNYPEQAARVQKGINLVKSGQAALGGEEFRTVIEFIRANSRNSPIILGCTEIVIGCRAAGIGIEPPLYDSADILAHATAQTVLISPSQNREDLFTEQRDIKQMLAFCQSKLIRYQLSLAKKNCEVPEEAKNLIEFLYQQQAKNPLEVADYRIIITKLFDQLTSGGVDDEFSIILGEILQHELAESPSELLGKSMDDFSNLIRPRLIQTQSDINVIPAVAESPSP